MSNNEISTDDGDIADALRDMAFIVDEVNKSGAAAVTMLSGDMFREAADEIDSLRKQLSACVGVVDELTRAGDSMVAVLRSGSDTGWDNAIDAWQEARRG